MKGKLIVIDGSDGTGKATQTNLLISKLKSQGIKVKQLDFPQYENNLFGGMVARYLNNEFGKATEIDPYLTSLMYAGDRWESKEKIEAWLSEGNIVVLNRYAQSNMAHQGSKIKDLDERKKFLIWLKELEFGKYKIPEPDAVIVLMMPTDLSQDLVDRKAKRSYTDLKRDGHESDTEYLNKTSIFYRELALQEGWHVVDCVKNRKLMSRDDIHNLVWEKVKELL